MEKTSSQTTNSSQENSEKTSDTPTFRVAIIGSGPAGIYAADMLTKSKLGDNISIDLIEDLPTPYGLIRYGVSPDHPRIKGIMKSLHTILDRGDIRFLGNVNFGKDVNLEDLQKFYNAIIFATGADKDAHLDVPGTDLGNVFGASDVVKWYDGHPDVDRSWPLDAQQIAVIGNGNVALDVARMLSKHSEDLLSTEISDNVFEGLDSSPVQDVHIFGRRGPQHMKFTPLELRELEHSRDVRIVLDPEDFDLSDEDMEALESQNQAKTMMKTLMNWLAADDENSSATRRLHLHFWHRPVEMIGDDNGRVNAIRFERTEVTDGQVQGSGKFIEYPIDSVYKAIGYFGTELKDIPFDPGSGTIIHDEGKVITQDGRPLPGLYTTGWIKRGPVGLIGSTKSDAQETINHLVADSATLPQPAQPNPEEFTSFLEEKNIPFTQWEGFKILEEHEKNLGAQWDKTDHERERIKVVPREEMTDIMNNDKAT